MSKSASLKMLEEQMRFYASQPMLYRAAWWEWATTQPNFREMATWALANERDEYVLRALRDWSERMAKNIEEKSDE